MATGFWNLWYENTFSVFWHNQVISLVLSECKFPRFPSSVTAALEGSSGDFWKQRYKNSSQVLRWKEREQEMKMNK